MLTSAYRFIGSMRFHLNENRVAPGKALARLTVFSKSPDDRKPGRAIPGKAHARLTAFSKSPDDRKPGRATPGKAHARLTMLSALPRTKAQNA